MSKKFIYVSAVMLLASALQIEAKKAPKAAPDPGYPTYSQRMYITTYGKAFYVDRDAVYPSQQAYDDFLCSMNEHLCGTGGIPEEFERPFPSTEPDPHGVKPTPEEKNKIRH